MAGETKFALARVAPAVFFISFAAIGWQLGLMRCLLIARYHHFSFLVISCALLGFGAGGAVLSLGRSWFEKHQEQVFRWGTVGFALSLPICFRLGEELPLNVYFPPALLIPTLGWWVAFWIIHCIPFLLAGLLIGLALMSAGKEAHRIYAVNLVGSAAGALGGILLLAYSSGKRRCYSYGALGPAVRSVPHPEGQRGAEMDLRRLRGGPLRAAWDHLSVGS